MRKKKEVVNKKLTKKELVKMLLENDYIKDGNEEELFDLLIDQPISIDVDKQEALNMSFGDMVSDKLSDIAGSWPFLLCFSGIILSWVLINGVLFVEVAFDPYPFILLNLFLSTIAALQAPIIMMSQNRQAKKDSIRNHNDYKIDLKSELILEELHDKIELLMDDHKKLIKLVKEYSDEKK